MGTTTNWKSLMAELPWGRTASPIAVAASPGMLLVVALAAAPAARAQDCKTLYRAGDKPLLFGGLGEPGRCVGSGCKKRTSFW